MRVWFSDVLKIAVGLWIAGKLTIVLALLFFEFTFPVIQGFARWLANG